MEVLRGTPGSRRFDSAPQGSISFKCLVGCKIQDRRFSTEWRLLYLAKRTAAENFIRGDETTP